MIQMAVLGFGTVGSGVVELIDRNADVIRKTIPQGIHVRYILDLRDFPESPYNDRVTHDYQNILDDEGPVPAVEPILIYGKKNSRGNIDDEEDGPSTVELDGDTLKLTDKEGTDVYTRVK